MPIQKTKSNKKCSQYTFDCYYTPKSTPGSELRCSPSSTKEQLIQGRIKIQKGKNNTEETKNSQLNYLVELYHIWV